MIWFLVACVASVIIGQFVESVMLTFVVRALVFGAVAIGGFVMFGATEKERTIIKTWCIRCSKKAHGE